jgi:hypothetical protein
MCERYGVKSTDERRLAYLSLRHYCPDAVRLIRGALDIGASGESLASVALRSLPKQPPTFVENAKTAIPLVISYMTEHPETGVVRWLEDGRWDFVEDVGLPREGCAHDWKAVDDEIGGTRESVVCRKCRTLGERDLTTGDVFWPAT